MATYKTLGVYNDDDEKDNDNNNNNNNGNITIITTVEKPIVLIVCKPIDLNLNQLNQHTSAPLL